jgi:luciferase family oxidoreductase group 1
MAKVTDGRSPDGGLPLRLSVLDQSPIPEGSDGGVALRNSVDLAVLADRLGYDRYWVAEHHGTPALACTSPEVLIGLIGAATARIRVGSGGVMLPHYSPLKVAETFSMLSGLFPGRVDLGLGRAAGTDRATAFALQRDRRHSPPDDFPDQLDELLGYVTGADPSERRFARPLVLPGRPHTPQPWLLGSSHQSAVWAAERGLPYVFADFINPNGAGIADLYRQQFVPSAHLERPRLAVAGWVVCAETGEEAERLASSFRMLMTLMHRGQLIPVPPPDKALAFLREEEGRLGAAMSLQRRLIVGPPAVVSAGIGSLAREYGAEEVMLVNILYDHVARRRSYELIAEAFGLAGARLTQSVAIG